MITISGLRNKSKRLRASAGDRLPALMRQARKGKNMKYKNAGSQGAYIDRLRVKYPFKIRRTAEPEYEGVLVGVQPLLDGQDIPIYSFPGGDCCEDPSLSGIEILEW